MTSFYNSLVATREEAHAKLTNERFVKMMNELFAGSNDQLLQAIPGMKASLLKQAHQADKNCVSATFLLEIDELDEELMGTTGMDIMLPMSYTHTCDGQIFLGTPVSRHATIYDTKHGLFLNDEDRAVTVRYICEFVPEACKLLQTIREHFDGEYTIKCNLYMSTSTHMPTFEIAVTYMFSE
jgi:hypothetical protein